MMNKSIDIYLNWKSFYLCLKITKKQTNVLNCIKYMLKSTLCGTISIENVVFSLIGTSKWTFFVVFRHMNKFYLPTYIILFGTSIIFFSLAIIRYFCDTLFKRWFFSQYTEWNYTGYSKNSWCELNSKSIKCVRWPIWTRRLTEIMYKMENKTNYIIVM